MYRLFSWPFALALVSLLSGLGTAEAASYIVIGTQTSNPQALQQRLQTEPGSRITRDLSALRSFVVTSSDPAFMQRLQRYRGIQTVILDPTLVLPDPPNQPLADSAQTAAQQREQALAAGAPQALAGGAVDLGLLSGNPLYQTQWALQDVGVTAAWQRGYSGSGVRVAILDSGIDCSNPWLLPNIDMTDARSFIDTENVCVQPGFYFNHGTHVAGIVAALPSGFGSVGIAPGATLIPVKVLSEYTGSGPFSAVLAGIVYASKQRADVINLSLGAFPLPVTNPQVNALRVLFMRATKYANQRGSSVVVAAGNDAAQLGWNGNIGLPASVPRAITVSANGPAGWATHLPQYAFLDYLAEYSNYGAIIDNSAPGGTTWYAYYVNAGQNCTIASLSFPCYVFDWVISTIPGGWSWAAGTSMATPAASAVAALAIEKARRQAGVSADGSARFARFRLRQPSLVSNTLKSTGVDRGPRGFDLYFGHGRISADNATNPRYGHGRPGAATAPTPVVPPFAQ